MNNQEPVRLDRKLFIFLLLFLLLLIILGWLSFIFVQYQIKTPLSSQSTEETFIIKKGESLKEIASQLEEANLIRNRIWFIAYVFYKGWAAHLQAGQYSLSPSLNIPQITQKIAKGEAVSQEIKVTIPEGFTLRQIEERLNSKFKSPAKGEARSRRQNSKLQLKSQNSKFYQDKYNFLEDAPAEATLEGFLFPDTYKFNPGAKEKEIITRMLDNFDRKLTEDFRAEIRRQSKTIFEVIIMASLLEKEVPTYQDQRLVAGIFWKRLRNNYPLESCATIAYILGIEKWRYSIEETEIKSPYNTYQNIGLPPGPICHPGLSAIKAAIYPQESDYNFFLTKPGGQTVFSQTFEEHNLNKAKYLQ